MGARFAKFSEGARQALSLALEESHRLSQGYIGTEHILLALTRMPETLGGRVLATMGIDPGDMRDAVEHTVAPGERRNPLQEVGLTPRSKRVIELAVEEARERGTQYVGTQHLLLGLVLEEEGIAAGVLRSKGVDAGRLRAVSAEALGNKAAPGEADSPGAILAVRELGPAKQPSRQSRPSPHWMKGGDAVWRGVHTPTPGWLALLAAGVAGGIIGGILVLLAIEVTR